MKNAKLSLVVLLLSLALPACTGDDPGGDDDGGTVDVGCETHAECGEGFVCAGGQCVVGECVPAIQDQCDDAAADPDEVLPYCCKPWEFCNFDRTCQYDPDFVGNQCEVDADCPNIGQFCSGANCYDAAGRTPCTASFQCAPDERCDREIALCVPDLGGCAFCSDTFPELCCEEGAACDLEDGFCVDLAGSQCTPETEEQNCLPNQTCDEFGRCVQCLTDDDCGPGTACNTGTGRCYSILGLCEDDGDCSGNKVCSPQGECVVAECTSDGPCIAEDSRQRCDLNTLTCYLPPASCSEGDEPNNTTTTATMIPLTGGAGTLCRGDTDYVGFPVTGGMRYRVTVSFPTSNVGGVAIAVVREGGGLLDDDVYSSFEDELTLIAITADDEEGSLFLRLVGSGDEADQWAYSITIEETIAPEVVSCAEETTLGIEPNDSFATAHDIAPGAYTFARCNDDDRDYYHVVLPPQSGIEVISEHTNSEGDLELELYSAPDSTSQIDRHDSVSGIERVEGPEAAEYWIQVGLYSDFTSGTDGQNYTLTVLAKPRPPECATDPGEPDDDVPATAPALTVGAATTAKHCVPADVDHRALTVPAGMSGTLALTFSHGQGDLRLDLLDQGGALVATSNSSTTSVGQESLELPVNGVDTTYAVRVRLHGGTSSVGQSYTLEASLYDAAVCLASEPVANESLAAGRCVGAVASAPACVGSALPSPLLAPSDVATCVATPETTGCGTLCGASDDDYYRVGKLDGGQLIIARLRYDPSSGRRMGLAVVRGNADLTAETWLDYDPDTSSTGALEVMTVVPSVPPSFAREYGVLVRPESVTTYPALPYALDVIVGAPCVADAAEPNESAGQSELLRTDGAPGVAFSADLDGTLCVGDLDVYELLAFQGEAVTVHLLAPSGLAVAIGERPADLAGPPTALVDATPVVGPCPIATPPGGGPTTPVCLEATLDVTAFLQQVFVTVRRASDDLITTTEPYVLRIQAAE